MLQILIFAWGKTILGIVNKLLVFSLADPKQNKVSVKIHTVWGIDSMKKNYEGLTFSSEKKKDVSNIYKKISINDLIC